MKSWLPWRFLISRIARRSGLLDPFTVLARLRRFSQPSEVQEPIELIRAGVAFHARGLVNTKVLQNNLDWIWPYWVTRQFDPEDPSFLPRAFSITHVNLTHRNWTALGLPGMAQYPIVDPRGLVTPLLDAWSLDWWFIPARRTRPLFPSLHQSVQQTLDLQSGLRVKTELTEQDVRLATAAEVTADPAAAQPPRLHLRAQAESEVPGLLVLAIRPVNPEGVSFIDTIRWSRDQASVNEGTPLKLDPPPDRWQFSTYAQGDVARHLDGPPRESEGSLSCPAGLATGAALFQLESGNSRTIEATLPLPVHGDSPSAAASPAITTWERALSHAPRLQVPDSQWSFLHDAALHTLRLLSPGEIFPGPYTYRRFWFRDACLILNALIAANDLERAVQLVATFPGRQRPNGYFHSQEGEWDANGQVLWIADRLERASGKPLPAELFQSLARGTEWIMRKRTRAPGQPHDGLLPPGFSAEHLGPNDYYYWDDFWGAAGLQAASRIARRRGADSQATRWHEAAADFSRAIERSLARLPGPVALQGIPASPHRRLDSGAIGSMVADYPLQLYPPGSERLLRTADWLARNAFQQGAFFQDMIHSGINAYLSLAIAQTFLRAGDLRYLDLIRAVAALASPTGQWPEAIHPRTGGGCMGDGQHAWAAAEWMLMMRALFVREEPDHLVICPGLPAEWLGDRGNPSLQYGPTATVWGPVTVNLNRLSESAWSIRVDARWHDAAPALRLQVPGWNPAGPLAVGEGCRLVRSAVPS